MDYISYTTKLCSKNTQDLLKRFISSRICGHQNVEDLVQACNFMALKKMSAYKDRGKFNQWILSIAYWTIRGWKKKEANAKVVFNTELYEQASDNFFEFKKDTLPEKYYAARKEIKKLLRKLPAKSNEIFSLYMDGLKPAQIQKETGYNICVIYKTKQRIKKAIEEKLKSLNIN